MEFVSVLLSGLLLLISPVGIVVDQVAEEAIRSRLADVESLDVRVDNGPSFQILQGRVDRVRIAGRGIVPIPGLRVELADFETDPIDLDFRSLRRGSVVLDEALQGALHLGLTEEDVNTFIRSPLVTQRLREVKIGSLNQAQARERERYAINNPAIEFLADNRLRVSVELVDLVQEGTLFIEAESGLSISQGDRLTLIGPVLIVNGQPAPDRLVKALLGDINERLSLQRLEEQGITARVINLAVEPGSLDLSLWVRVDSSVTAPSAATGS
ncbi:MAG: DUF2993 domain-containing protein [Cyanobacteria bacterium P01_D01_bin.105]